MRAVAPEAVAINETQEALLLQRLRVQVPEVLQIPRSVQELEKLVEQLESERDRLVDQLKNQRSMRLVQIGSRPTRVGTIHQTASKGRRHTDKPAVSRMLDCLQAIGVERCSRDGRHWDHQGVVPVSFHGCPPDGVFPFHGFQHGLLKQVPPLRRALWGWRGVRVGEASNLGPQTRVPADCRTQCRTV